MKMNKKGLSINDMFPIVVTLVLVGVVMGVGLVVLQNFQDASSINGTDAATAINDTQGALGDFASDWLPIIVIAIAAAIILALVIGGFAGKR